jgi:hypothetical protein
LAVILELHYTRDMSQDNDTVVVPGIGTVATMFERRDVLNLTTGFHGELGPDTAIRFAVGVPLTKKLNRDFDAEFIVTLVRRI